jgi:hypothetical protein
MPTIADEAPVVDIARSNTEKWLEMAGMFAHEFEASAVC